MTKSQKDSLGDRMKRYEHRYLHTVMPMLPILARLDGRAFHRFTNGLQQPYDESLSSLMVDTARFLVQQTGARCGYTQSDEISLVWLTEEANEELFFGGKTPKLISVVASLATAYFNKHLPQRLPDKAHEMPVFDNRVWEVPSREEAANYFVWREQDAVRNSIMSAARSLFSHAQCYKKNSSDLQEMLFQRGINWNDYPSFFKRGTYIRRCAVESSFSAEELEDLPPKHNARTDPDMVLCWSVLTQEDLPPLTQIANRAEVILFGNAPILRAPKLEEERTG